MSILHGRPVSLSDSDVDAALPTDFPGLMPSGQVSNHTNMVTLINLTLKLGQVAHEMYAFASKYPGYALLTLRRQIITP